MGLTDGSTGVLLCSVPLPLPCPTLPRPQGSRVHGDRGDNVDLHCFPAHHTGPSASSGGGACDKEAESTKALCSSQGVCKEVRGVGMSIGPPDHPPLPHPQVWLVLALLLSSGEDLPSFAFTHNLESGCGSVH